MPQRSSTYFHYWVDENEFLFIDFAYRVKELIPLHEGKSYVSIIT